MRVFIAGALAALFLTTVAAAQDDAIGEAEAAGIISPIAVANAMVAEMTAERRLARQAGEGFNQLDINRPYLALVNIHINHIPDDAEIAAAWAEIAFLNFRAVDARAAYRGLLDQPGLLGDHVWRRYMQIQFRAFEEVDEAIELFDSYRERFPPRPENVTGSSQMVQNLAGYYSSNGDTDQAARLILDVIASTPADAAYLVFTRIPANRDLLNDAGLLDEANTLLTEKRDALSATLATLRATPQLASEDPYLVSGLADWYWTMQGRLPGETFQATRERQIVAMIDGLDMWLESEG